MLCRKCGYPLRALVSPVCPECGRPFDPTDPTTFARRQSPLFTIGIIAVTLLAIASGSYLVGYVRSQNFGLSLRGVLGGLLVQQCSLIFFGSILLTLYAALGLRSNWRRLLLNLLVIVILSIAIPEGWCGAQDLRFYRRFRNVPPIPRSGHSEARWWPYTDHHIYYDLESGEWAGGC